MPKNPTDYSETIIYKLVCKDSTIKDIYIGHTTNFVQRKNSHKISCCTVDSVNYNRYVYQFIRNNGGWDNWSMIQVQVCNLKNKREAESTEHFWIEKLAATLNSNKPFAMCKENPQQYKHNWYEEKKDYILEKAKQHYETNKEQKLEYQKQYAEENKEKVKEYQDEYREKNKEKLSEQKKEYRAEHKEDAAKANKEWREANKDKIKAERSQVIQCECGHSYTFGNKHRHLQTKVHTAYQNQLEGKQGETNTNEPTISEEEKTKLEEDKIAHTKQKQKEYREKNAEKIKENRKKYNELHKEHNKEQRKKYYDSHKEQIMEQNKLYIAENKEKIKEYKDAWYQKKKASVSVDTEIDSTINTIQSI